jgi:hypothetical protein
MLCAGLTIAVASGASPSRTSWARAANAICTAENVEIARLPDAKTTALLISEFPTVIRFQESVDSKMAAVPRPDNERAMIASLLALDRKVEVVGMTKLLPEIRRHPSSWSASQINRKFQTLGGKYNALARELGATVCAE